VRVAAGWAAGAAIAVGVAVGAARVEGAGTTPAHPGGGGVVLGPPIEVRRTAGSGAPAAFGAAVALGRDRAYVGAPRGGRAGGGAVHVFGLAGPGGGAPAATWSGVLRDPGGAAGDRFGAAVTCAGAALAVGAPRAARRATGEPLVGRVLVFDGAAGDEDGDGAAVGAGAAPAAALEPPAGVGPARFGSAIAARVVDGRIVELAIGAPSAAVGGAVSAGTVAVHGGAAVDWAFAARRDAPGAPAAARSFGAALAFVGDTLVVGAPGDGAVAPGGGRVYGFGPDGALRFALGPLELLGGASPADVAGARLGTSLAAIGARAFAVGAPGKGLVVVVPLDGAGAASPPASSLVRGSALGGFGVRVAASREAVFVSAPWPTSSSSGEVFEFRPDGAGGWRLARTHRPGAAAGAHAAGTEFGVALAVRGSRLVVGQPSSSDPGRPGPAGVAHLFRAGR